MFWSATLTVSDHHDSPAISDCSGGSDRTLNEAGTS